MGNVANLYLALASIALRNAVSAQTEIGYSGVIEALGDFDRNFYYVRKNCTLLSEEDKIKIGLMRYDYGTVSANIVNFERNQGFLLQECYIPNYYLLFDDYNDGIEIDASHSRIRANLMDAYEMIKVAEKGNHPTLELFESLMNRLQEKIPQFDGLELGRYAALIFRYDGLVDKLKK